MISKPSTALINEYTEISALAKFSGEPIVITDKGEADLVILSVDAFEERDKMIRHREKIYEAEIARLNGIPTYTRDQILTDLKELYAAAEE